MTSDDFKKRVDEFSKEPQRLVLSQKKSLNVAYPVTKQSSTSGMVDDALSIVDEQLEKIKIRSRHESFEMEDMKILQLLIKSLVDLSKEEREREKSEKDMEDLSKLTHEELLQLASSKLSAARETK